MGIIRSNLIISIISRSDHLATPEDMFTPQLYRNAQHTRTQKGKVALR